MYVDENFYSFTNTHRELNSIISVHIFCFISKNVIVFLAADYRNPNIPLMLKRLVIKNTLSIYCINLFLIISYLWPLFKIDIEGYRNAFYSGFCLQTLGICNGFQLLLNYYTHKIDIYWFLVIFIVIVAFYEIRFIFKAIKILKPISIRTISCKTTDSKIIEAWQTRNAFINLRMGMLGFAAVAFFKELAFKYMFVFNSNNKDCDHLPGSNVNRSDAVLDVLVFFATIFCAIILSLRFNEEHKLDRIINMISMLFIICVDAYFIPSHMPKSLCDCSKYEVYHLFRLIFFTYCFAIAINEYKTIGQGLCEFLKTKDELIRDKKL